MIIQAQGPAGGKDMRKMIVAVTAIAAIAGIAITMICVPGRDL